MKDSDSKKTSAIDHIIALTVIMMILVGVIPISVEGNSPIWEQTNHPYSDTDVSFRDIVFINSTHGWTTGITSEGIGGGIILHSNDSGRSWYEQYHDSEQRFRQIALIDAMRIWGTGFGRLIYTIDGGKSWTNSTTIGSGTTGLSSVTFSNSTHGWTSTNNDIFKTRDSGQSWENITSWNFPDTAREFEIRGSEIWVISFYGIYYSSDYGIEWQQLYSQGGWSLSFISSGGAWAVGSEMLASSFDGYSWSPHELPRPSPIGGVYPPYFSDVIFMDSFNGWIGGLETPVAYTPNGGLDWYDQGIEIDTRIMGLDFINMTHGWAVGSKGTILRTTKGTDIGTRLWRGVTDYVILIPIGVSILGIIVVIIRKKRRVRKQLPLSNQPSSSIGIE
jgi:photosystem II stability/assembly factor-like uncharacterized protein